jgi:hypothetical protein
MKRKNIYLLVILLFAPQLIFADGMVDLAVGIGSGVVEVTKDIRTVAEYREHNYKSQISDLVLEIPDGTSKDEFYLDHKVKSWGPALSNLFLGFGLGSNSQGNIPSSVIQKNIDSIAWGVGLGVPVICFSTMLLLFPIYALGGQDVFEDNPLVTVSLASLVIGGSVSLINRTFGVISAFTFANKYNKELNKQLELAIVPAYNGSVSLIGKVCLN